MDTKKAFGQQLVVATYYWLVSYQETQISNLRDS